MVYFDSADKYVESCATLKEKIKAINDIQTALLDSALKAAAKGDISQYSLNDGQVIISTTYRNATEITNAYDAFERIKQRYIIQLNGGRMVRLVDSKNFRRNGRFR